MFSIQGALEQGDLFPALAFQESLDEPRVANHREGLWGFTGGRREGGGYPH